VAQQVRAFAPDLLLSYWLYPDAFGAAIVARQLGVPLVSGARGSDLRARDRMSLALTGIALRRSTALVTVSEDLRRIAIARHGLEPNSITTIPNGCDTSIFHPGNRDGRLVAAKGLRELFAAWRTLADKDAGLHLAFVGDGALMQELRTCSAQSGMGERVHLPGVADAARVATWMRAANVFCLPSYTEGYPNVLVEALACGRPVVATPVGGVVEIVDAANGLLAEPRDVPGLANALRSALEREWDAAELSRRFLRSWPDVARQTLAACEAAITRYKSAS
jgi:glycosyltransferase involved in cell wall biosynthesis